MMPKIVSKSHNPHVFKTTPTQHKKRRLEKSIGVVPAKDPSKVKLENFFHNSRVPELGKLCIPWIVRVLGFLQQVGLIFFPWHRGLFLVRTIFITTHILRDPFFIGIPSSKVYLSPSASFYQLLILSMHSSRLIQVLHPSALWWNRRLYGVIVYKGTSKVVEFVRIVSFALCE